MGELLFTDDLQRLMNKSKMIGLINTLNEDNATEFFKDCIPSNLIVNDKKKNKPSVQPTNDLCVACSSGRTIIIDGQDVCQDCGVVMGVVRRQTYNAPLQNTGGRPQTIEINVKGVRKIVDINKLKLYPVGNLTKEQRLYREGLNMIESVILDLSVTPPTVFQETALNYWWRIINSNLNFRGNTKKCLLLLCIYYSAHHNNYEFFKNIYRLTQFFNVTIKDVAIAQPIFKKLFNNESKFDISIEESLEYPDKAVVDYAENVKTHLLDSGFIREPLSTAMKAGLLYYSAQQLRRKVSLKETMKPFNYHSSSAVNTAATTIRNYLIENPITD